MGKSTTYAALSVKAERHLRPTILCLNEFSIQRHIAEAKIIPTRFQPSAHDYQLLGSTAASTKTVQNWDYPDNKQMG